MTLDSAPITDSRFAQLLCADGAGQLAAKAQPFLSAQRGPEALARLFGVFRVDEHHAVITIGNWLKDTPELEARRRSVRARGGEDRQHPRRCDRWLSDQQGVTAQEGPDLPQAAPRGLP